VGTRLGSTDLHLPELYSGCPWRHANKWVAFLGLNPSIDTREVYPTISMYRNAVAPDGLFKSHVLTPFFENRFHAEDNDPLWHGRSRADRDQRPTYWVLSEPHPPKPKRNRTWTTLDRVLRDALAETEYRTLATPLGVVGAVVDAVPWKFRAWACVDDETRCELLERSRAYLGWWLEVHHAAAIVTTGVDAWSALVKLHPAVGSAATGDSDYRVSHLVNWRGGRAIVIGVHHPTTQGFNRLRPRLVAALADVLRSATIT
jgi:hypothetical protein